MLNYFTENFQLFLVIMIILLNKLIIINQLSFNKIDKFKYSQIDFYGYHSIENSRFSMLILSFQKYPCQKLWRFKVLDHFEGLASLISKYFIDGAMEPLNCIYILSRHQIPYIMVLKNLNLKTSVYFVFYLIFYFFCVKFFL